MNREAILAQLTEASKQLDATIEALKVNPEYGVEEFKVEMGHLYHHLNFAWNGRNCTDEEYRSAAHFHDWRKFPSNNDLFL